MCSRVLTKTFGYQTMGYQKKTLKMKEIEEVGQAPEWGCPIKKKNWVNFLM